MRAGDPGRSAVSSTALRKLSHDQLASLRDRCACTASLAVLDGADIVYVDRARSLSQGQSEAHTRLGPGSRLPAKTTATGRALLAQLPHEEQCRAIDAGVEQPTSDEAVGAREQLIDELARIRKTGFAVADQVHVEGQRCVAAPLKARSGNVIGAVELAVAKSALSSTQVLERLVGLLLSGAEEMSAQLG
jgi:IclR family pca regulon transcriptional regulator